MGKDKQSEVNELIDNCVNMIENIEILGLENIEELFLFQKQLIDIINKDVKTYGTEARVLLCQCQDIVLDKLVEFDNDYTDLNLKKIYTPAIQGYRHWSSVELMKDKGLVGYFMSRVTGARHVMLFCDEDIEYSYNDLLVGQELVYSNKEQNLSDQYYEYLMKNYKDMDMLILQGMYGETISFLELYRKLRPDGKVFCGLDMNSTWLDNINWSSSSVRRFASQCDVIATSSVFIRDKLNSRKDVNFPCYYLPNAFSNLFGLNIKACANEKENIILTVARIGSSTKNNLELLAGFAVVADRMPDWTLKLVGPIEKDFLLVIEKFFEKFPKLVNRIIFTGAIYDKQKLYDEYAKAKCFVLTSLSEGGTPNVYSEALNHGCKFIVSSIDSAEEMICYGELGYTYKTGNVKELAQCLLKINDTSSVEDFEIHIEKSKEYARNCFDWDNNIKKLAYMFKNM